MRLTTASCVSSLYQSVLPSIKKNYKMLNSIIFQLSINCDFEMLTTCSPRDSGLVWWVWHSGWEQVDTPCHHSPSGEAMKDRVKHTWHLSTIQDDFQYYRNHRSNSWVSEGALHVMPTLTASEYGEDFLHNGCIDLNKEVSELSPPGTCHLSNYCSAPWFHF